MTGPIVQVSSVLLGGGIDNQTVQTCVGLRELGETVILAAPPGRPLETPIRQAGVPVVHFSAEGRLRLAMIRSLAGLLRREHCPIVHAHAGKDYWPVILAARLAGTGTRVIITRHLMTRPSGMSRWCLLRAARVVAVSRAVERVLRHELKGPKRRLHQIHCGIDLTAFTPARTDEALAWRREQNWPADAIGFGLIGFFNPPRGKGHLEFLAAAAALRLEFPQARFVMAGSGGMADRLRQRMLEPGLDGIVSILPFTTEVPLLLNALDVLVHPAVGTEALGLVLLEAMASGKPVVASNLDGIPEAVTHEQNGLLTPPGDVPALVAALRRLAADAGLRERMGRAGRQRVEREFTRQILAGKLRELYRQALA